MRAAVVKNKETTDEPPRHKETKKDRRAELCVSVSLWFKIGANRRVVNSLNFKTNMLVSTFEALDREKA